MPVFHSICPRMIIGVRPSLLHNDHFPASFKLKRWSVTNPVRYNSMMSSKPKTLPLFSMEGKVCLVTGAARGLGYEFCRAFIESGSTSLAILDLKAEEAVAAATEIVDDYVQRGEVKEGVLDVMGVACDVSNEDSVKSAFEEVISRFGCVDAVVASAGIVENFTAFDYPTDRMKRLYDINVHGAYFTAREAARIMVPRKSGSIILIASMSANIINLPQPQTPYNTSKAAVKHMAASLAVEWAESGVRVNALSPGYMLTKLTRTILSNNQDLKKTWEQLTPMKRMGDPEDLKGAIVYLASDASKFMTGSELRVDVKLHCPLLTASDMERESLDYALVGNGWT